MAYYYNTIMNTFWSEHIWLPPNTTWKDIAPDADANVRHADPRHLFYPLPMALILLILRYILEKYWFAPVGISLGIKNSRPKKTPDIPALEKAYTLSKKWKHKQIQGLAKQLDMTERQVERWLRLRKGHNKPSTLIKFCENSWRCLYYILSFIYGLTILWEKPWLWNINECWTNFPHQSVTDDIWWYYMVSMSFYWSLSVSQFFDVRRKDFWQMFIHHIATIILMCLSWIVNVFRVGTLVLLVHDCADIFLEAAKMAKYSGYQKFCDAIFALFTVLWIVTRIGIFPFWIIRKDVVLCQSTTDSIICLTNIFYARLMVGGLTAAIKIPQQASLAINYFMEAYISPIILSTSIDAPKIVPMFPAYYIFNGLLILLLFLHCIWTYLILKIVHNSLNAGQMEGDIRSSSDDYSEDSKSQ